MLARRLFLLLALLAPRALGELIPGAEVRVERSENAFACPGEAELVQAALALGTAPSGDPGAPLSVVVRLEADGTALRALVRTSGRKTGERELRTEGPDCTKLAEAVTVVLAVLLDLVPPEAVASYDAPRPATRTAPPTPPPAAPPSGAPAPPPSAAPVPAEPFALMLRAEGGLALGPLGIVLSPSLGGAAALGRRRWELALGGTWLAPHRVPFAPVPDTRVDLTLAFGTAEGCLRFAQSAGAAVDAWACGRVSAGLLTGEGKGFDQTDTERALWLAAGPAVTARLRLNRVLSLRGGLGVLVTLGRRTFVVRDYGNAFESPPVSATLTLGPELTIL